MNVRKQYIFQYLRKYDCWPNINYDNVGKYQTIAGYSIPLKEFWKRDSDGNMKNSLIFLAPRRIIGPNKIFDF